MTKRREPGAGRSSGGLPGVPLSKLSDEEFVAFLRSGRRRNPDSTPPGPAGAGKPVIAASQEPERPQHLRLAHAPSKSHPQGSDPLAAGAGARRRIGITTELQTPHKRPIAVLLSGASLDGQLHIVDGITRRDSLVQTPLSDMFRAITGWLSRDAKEFPGKQSFEVLGLGVDSPRFPMERGHGGRAQQLIQAADLHLRHVSEPWQDWNPELHSRTSNPSRRATTLTLTDDLGIIRSGSHQGRLARMPADIVSHHGIEGALGIASDLARAPLTVVRDFLQLADTEQADLRSAEWILLAYIYIRDLACQRNCIDADALANRYAKAVTSATRKVIPLKPRAHDPLLRFLLGATKLRNPLLPPKYPIESRRSIRLIEELTRSSPSTRG